MFGYMTELDTVDAQRTETVTAEGSILTFFGKLLYGRRGHCRGVGAL